MREAGISRKEHMAKRQEEKLRSARERAEYRATLTPEQQLARLDEKLGEGIGAVKERARLKALIK